MGQPAPPDEPVVADYGDLDEYMRWLTARVRELDQAVMSHEPKPKDAAAFAVARIGWEKYALAWFAYSSPSNFLSQNWAGVRGFHMELEEERFKFQKLGVAVPKPTPKPKSPLDKWWNEGGGWELVVAGAVVAGVVLWRATR